MSFAQMARRLSIIVVALFVLSFTVAACGDDDKKKDDKGDTPAQTDTGEATPTVPQVTVPETSVPGASDDTVEECKKAVDDSAAPDDQKEAAKKLCDAASGGKIEDQRKSAGEACKQQAETLATGAARDQAIAACERLSGE